MRKFIVASIVFAFMGFSVTTQAQNQVTVVYEDNSGNNGKVEWTRTMEINDAAVGIPRNIKVPVKNISQEPLRITSVKTHCGCTEAIAPESPIAPGGTGYVEVIYTAKERYENGVLVAPPFSFYQIVDVTTNFDPKNSVVISVQGTVIK
jgi:hypothetical protein